MPTAMVQPLDVPINDRFENDSSDLGTHEPTDNSISSLPDLADFPSEEAPTRLNHVVNLDEANYVHRPTVIVGEENRVSRPMSRRQNRVTAT